MTGSLLHAPSGELPDDPYRRAVVRLDDGSDVAYRDVRRFGTWLLLEPDEVEPYVDTRSGASRSATRSRRSTRRRSSSGRKAPVKAAILDQRTVAGVGNIYADEALWRARIHPLTPAGALEPDEVGALHRGIRKALAARHRASRLDAPRLPRAERRQRVDAGRVQGVRP